MNNQERSANDPRIAHLRKVIGAIEATSADLIRAPKKTAGSDAPRDRKPTAATSDVFSYPGMPEGEDWMMNVPARYRDGEGGFDRRLMEELATAGAPCYTLDDLTKARTIPQGIPIFIDWLQYLEERVPGPETKHRLALRTNLIRNLNDPAARGNQAAIDVLIEQLQNPPALSGFTSDFATRALARIATKKEFARIAMILEQLPQEAPRGALIEYMGKVRTPEARDTILRYLDTEWTYFALKALIAMKAAGVRDRIEPYLQDPNSMVRKYARQAMEKLPA